MQELAADIGRHGKQAFRHFCDAKGNPHQCGKGNGQNHISWHVSGFKYQ